MSIQINNNILSTLIQRNLSNASDQVNQSSNRLSSGQRINTSADDPSGMATSEQYRYELQGLRQNQQNVSGAISMVGTAESQLGSLVNMLQSARELVVQAGNSTLSPSDRQAIQTELNQSLAEIDRVASTARFNDQYLLNGQLQNASIQIGTHSNETIQMSLGDFRIAALGACATKTSDLPVSAAAISAGTVTIGGVQVPASVSDGFSTAQASGSALAKANAINSIESSTGVHATALPTQVTGAAPIQALTLDATHTLTINGVAIAPGAVQAGDAGGALIKAINAQSAQTGVTASVTSSGALQLSAADGRNIALATTGSIGDKLGLRAGNGDVNSVTTAQIKLSSAQPFTVGDAGGLLGMSAPLEQVAIDPTTALKNLSVADPDGAAAALNTIDTALAQVNAGQSTVGAIYNRLDSLTDSLTQRVNNLTQADSSLRDTDFAYESARLTQAQILQEAAIALLTQANATPKRALQLLEGG